MTQPPARRSLSGLLGVPTGVAVPKPAVQAPVLEGLIQPPSRVGDKGETSAASSAPDNVPKIVVPTNKPDTPPIGTALDSSALPRLPTGAFSLEEQRTDDAGAPTSNSDGVNEKPGEPVDLAALLADALGIEFSAGGSPAESEERAPQPADPVPAEKSDLLHLTRSELEGLVRTLVEPLVDAAIQAKVDQAAAAKLGEIGAAVKAEVEKVSAALKTELSALVQSGVSANDAALKAVADLLDQLDQFVSEVFGQNGGFSGPIEKLGREAVQNELIQAFVVHDVLSVEILKGLVETYGKEEVLESLRALYELIDLGSLLGRITALYGTDEFGREVGASELQDINVRVSRHVTTALDEILNNSAYGS